jgi:hypothetical protein
MPTKARCASLILSAFSSEAWASDPNVEINTTLCREGETIYISCAFDGGLDQDTYEGEVASICAKNNTSPDKGYVQYRYGTPTYGYKQEKLELQYPEEQRPPNGVFNIYISSHPKSLGTAIAFQRGAYTYSFESLGVTEYRVVVRKGTGIIFNKQCTLPGKNYLIDKAYQGIEQTNTDQDMKSAFGSTPLSRRFYVQPPN